MSKSKVERSFGGIVITAENYRTMDKDQLRLEQKHLKAYLKGRPYFTHGAEEIPNDYGLIQTVPRIFVVKETLKQLN